MMKKFEEFQIPDDSVLQCYLRKYKTYDKENIPFIEYSPTEEELQVNRRICEQKAREKEAAKAEAKRRRDEKRAQNRSRRNRANDDEEVPEVQEEVPEVFAQDYLDDIIDELAGPDAELDALIGGFFERNPAENQPEEEIILEEVQQPRSRRRSRVRRPAPKLRDQYEF